MLFLLQTFLKRDDADTRSRANSNRRHGKKCTSMYISYLRDLHCANLVSVGTTAILGGSDTLRIVSSNVLPFGKTCKLKRQCRFNIGTDAAGYIRSDVSTLSKLAAKSIQGSMLLAMRRSRCAVYFQKTIF